VVTATHGRERGNLCSPCVLFPSTLAPASTSPSTTLAMPRAKVLRTRRMAYIMAEGQFHLRDSEYTYEDERTVCPYCRHEMKSSINRSRHIMLRPECRQRHMNELKARRERERERAYKTAGPSKPRPPPEASGAGPSTQPHTNSGPRYNDPRRWGDDGRTCREPYVEHFPFRDAGKPISRTRTYPQNLGAYLASCGNLANRDWFETAEVLMTTGLSGKARTRHLQTPVVSRYPSRMRDNANRTQLIVQEGCGAVVRQSHPPDRY
jgi:hypothetical protein